MWPFSSEKKPVELSKETKAKYENTPTSELKTQAEALKSKRDKPTLTTDDHLSSLAYSSFLSTEALIGQVGGLFAPAAVNMLIENSKTQNTIAKSIQKAAQGPLGMVGGNVVLPALLGLNGYRRYIGNKRSEQSETAKTELNFVEKLLHERESALVADKVR